MGNRAVKQMKGENMFCPKCGMENTEGSSICRGCGWVLASAAPTVAAAVKAKTSGLAIA